MAHAFCLSMQADTQKRKNKATLREGATELHLVVPTCRTAVYSDSMYTMERWPPNSQASLTGDPRLTGGLVAEPVAELAEVVEEHIAELIAELAAKLAWGAADCQSSGPGSTISGSRPKWRCTRPSRRNGGMRLASQVMTAPMLGGSFRAHSDALQSWRSESQMMMVQAGRLPPCSMRNWAQGCASRQSVTSTNPRRGDFRSHRENWLAFFKQMRDAPKPRRLC
mmetsp:Transcript_27811/g.88397  ORF Transcript_27811/g.88397 Transcript_27811/m.88397 type:complete len:224 (-) Transcript_27811:292-963(-)